MYKATFDFKSLLKSWRDRESLLGVKTAVPRVRLEDKVEDEFLLPIAETPITKNTEYFDGRELTKKSDLSGIILGPDIIPALEKIFEVKAAYQRYSLKEIEDLPSEQLFSRFYRRGLTEEQIKVLLKAHIDNPHKIKIDDVLRLDDESELVVTNRFGIVEETSTVERKIINLNQITNYVEEYKSLGRLLDEQGKEQMDFVDDEKVEVNAEEVIVNGGVIDEDRISSCEGIENEEEVFYRDISSEVVEEEEIYKGKVKEEVSKSSYSKIKRFIMKFFCCISPSD